MTRPYGVLIIGAGNIGAGYDRPDSNEVLTHAHAFSTTQGFNLLGFVDSKMNQAQKAAAIWGGKAFADLSEALAAMRVDIAVVAVPDEYHYPVLAQLFQSGIGFIFLEKPVARVWDEAVQISKWQQQMEIPVLVNYSRRFVPEFSRLRQQIQGGEWGEYICGTGYYGKGIIHTGSHLIDLLRYLVGEVVEVHKTSEVDDFYPDDPTVSGKLVLEGGSPFYIQSIDCRNYWIFELDLLFSKGRLRFTDSSFAWEEYRIESSSLYAGSRDLSRVASYKSSLDKSLQTAALDILAYLEMGEPLVCSLPDAIRDMQVCLQLKDG